MTPARFPHSDTPGSTLGCQLPRAYRRLLRPSSALDAKASTMCPSQLVTHTTNPTPPTTPPTNGRSSQAEPDRRCTQHATKEPHTPPTIRAGHAKNKKKHTHPTRTNRSRGTGASPDARVHYPDLKQQPHTRHRRPTAPTAQQGGAEAQPSLAGRSDPSEPQQCVADETAWSFHIPKTAPEPPHEPGRHSAGRRW